MENDENFSNGKGIFKPEKHETFVKYEWGKFLGHLRKPNNQAKKKKHFKAVIARKGYTIDYLSGV